MYTPSREQFIRQAQSANLIAVSREILADTDTPVSVYMKLDSGRGGFLLESVTGGENLARYSFLGAEPSYVLSAKGQEIVEIVGGQAQTRPLRGKDPLDELKAYMSRYIPAPAPELPPFWGGAVGYMGYNLVSFFEPVACSKPDDQNVPDCLFMVTDSIVIFDHIRHCMRVVAHAHIGPGDAPDACYDQAVARIEAIIERMRRTHVDLSFGAGRPQPLAAESNISEEEYCRAVQAAKEYILAGDVFQVVLSLRRKLRFHAQPFDLYRALRRINPSPYMFYIRYGEMRLAGSSPEILVKLQGRKIQLRPIAGTRKRGATPEEDAALERELLADPKERAEHVMLVDLGRNDVGRVAVYNSVRVTEMMVIERYSHVMHIVSNVVGELLSDKDLYDLLRATFPAGTLTGAPKVRAMQIIDELEPTARGPYGGAVGYIGFSGNLDTGIILRTIVIRGDVAYVQAGAGIVADSVPRLEYQECMNKSAAMLRAIELAESSRD